MTECAPIRILGVGNVLTSDDGLGPTVIKHLEAKYTFADAVEIIDVGTPGLDFTPYLASARSVIVVDSVRGESEPGTIRVWRDEEILAAPPVARTNPHEPGLREALMATELTDSSPEEIVLIGVIPERVEAGTALSNVVQEVVPDVISRVLAELDRLGVSARQREQPLDPDIWWE
ncbi:MAG: hydrogenase maturation protease [Thermoanaerobaculales bacterium]|nr:hydrogenase maturation protease [Thermoanaerobaculales bacterium]